MQKSIQRELVEFQSYLQSEGYSLAKASSAAFSKGIHKFSHGVFEGMTKLVVDFMYNECDDTQYWKGHTVLAVDGSTVEVSNDKKVIDEWKVVETFYHSEAKSEIVTLNLPKKYGEQAAALGIEKKEIQVRLVKVELDSGRGVRQI